MKIEKPKKNYQCLQCGEVIQDIKRPDRPCPKPTSSRTNCFWQDNGEIGDNKYYCKQCKVTIYSKAILSPIKATCPKHTSYNSDHAWVKK